MNTNTATSEERSENFAIGDVVPMIRRKRKIRGMSAILLPFLESGEIDWQSLERHLARTVESGLIPAVNMDTGFAHLIDSATRARVLDFARSISHSEWPVPFVAGAFVKDQPGAAFDADAYRRQMEQVESHGGLPVIFQSHGLVDQEDDQIVAGYELLAGSCEGFLAFELGTMFAPFGKIYSLAVFARLMQIKKCIGAKHSSLNRQQEWRRLVLRDRQRPDFLLLTGNDLAIDMVMYGSDYLLGLSTFAPDLFTRRDAFWHDDDPRFYELNDLLQYLGFFAFRAPTPAYKHSAAMFLHQRGWIQSDRTHPESPGRPASDRAILREIVKKLEDLDLD